jgi:hypothetical protein
VRGPSMRLHEPLSRLSLDLVVHVRMCVAADSYLVLVVEGGVAGQDDVQDHAEAPAVHRLVTTTNTKLSRLDQTSQLSQLIEHDEAITWMDIGCQHDSQALSPIDRIGRPSRERRDDKMADMAGGVNNSQANGPGGGGWLTRPYLWPLRISGATYLHNRQTSTTTISHHHRHHHHARCLSSHHLPIPTTACVTHSPRPPSRTRACRRGGQ